MAARREGSSAGGRNLRPPDVAAAIAAGGAREEAIALALRLLSIDPLQEDVDRALMRLSSDLNQTALALRQYKRCETILRKELNVEPDQETKALYQELLRLRTRRSAPSDKPSRTPQPPSSSTSLK